MGRIQTGSARGSSIMAMKYSNRENQIIRRVGGDEGTLYSENLY